MSHLIALMAVGCVVIALETAILGWIAYRLCVRPKQGNSTGVKE